MAPPRDQLHQRPMPPLSADHLPVQCDPPTAASWLAAAPLYQTSRHMLNHGHLDHPQYAAHRGFAEHPSWTEARLRFLCFSSAYGVAINLRNEFRFLTARGSGVMVS